MEAAKSYPLSVVGYGGSRWVSDWSLGKSQRCNRSSSGSWERRWFPWDTRREKRHLLFCLLESASVPEFTGFPHPVAPWLPTRWGQVCVVCHLHTEGAVRASAGGWHPPAERVHLNTWEDVWKRKSRGSSRKSLNLFMDLAPTQIVQSASNPEPHSTPVTQELSWHTEWALVPCAWHPVTHMAWERGPCWGRHCRRISTV